MHLSLQRKPQLPQGRAPNFDGAEYALRESSTFSSFNSIRSLDSPSLPRQSPNDALLNLITEDLEALDMIYEMAGTQERIANDVSSLSFFFFRSQASRPRTRELTFVLSFHRFFRWEKQLGTLSGSRLCPASLLSSLNGCSYTLLSDRPPFLSRTDCSLFFDCSVSTFSIECRQKHISLSLELGSQLKALAHDGLTIFSTDPTRLSQIFVK